MQYNDKKYLENLFYYNLNNYLFLENRIYDGYEMYKEEPNDGMIIFLVDVCDYGKKQLSFLIDMLPNVFDGYYLSKYQKYLETKGNELSNIKKVVIKELHK